MQIWLLNALKYKLGHTVNKFIIFLKSLVWEFKYNVLKNWTQQDWTVSVSITNKISTQHIKHVAPGFSLLKSRTEGHGYCESFSSWPFTAVSS